MHYDPQKVQITHAQFDSEKNADQQQASARFAAKNAQAPQEKKFKPAFKVETKKVVPKFQGILIERFRAALTKRGSRGIIGLGRQFRIADDDGSGFLNQVEFVKCIKDFGVQIEDQDIISLFKSMDTDNSGEISFDEFLRTYVGDMNAFRVSLVEKAYKTMDFNNDG